ncbi:hypothetical protein ACGFZR_24605 [Streptomyces sp. NPDC048241]|uniref:hypothetical protein n=1 Tax=Streptomyces sp. NPDC048241 TaxID=3365521 RepID=UPI00371C012A
MSAPINVFDTLGNATVLLDSGATGFSPDLREALIGLLGTIAEQGHTQIPAPEDPPSNCGSCGGTGERYLGVGPDGHAWSGESCCCSHTHCSCGACDFPCDLASYALEVAQGLRSFAEEQSSRPAADATPGLTERQARLLDAIRTHDGQWTTSRALSLYALTDPGVVQRGTARRDLAALHRAGHLVLVDTDPNRKHYLLHRKDGGL